jgi:hypothetical protein
VVDDHPDDGDGTQQVQVPIPHDVNGYRNSPVKANETGIP